MDSLAPERRSNNTKDKETHEATGSSFTELKGVNNPNSVLIPRMLITKHFVLERTFHQISSMAMCAEQC